MSEDTQRRPLPPPATQIDEYMHDAAMSLRQMSDQLAAITDMLAQMNVELAGVQDGEFVSLREPDGASKTPARKAVKK